MCSTSTKLWPGRLGYTLFFLLAIVAPAFPQLVQSLRFEVPLGGNEKNFDVIPTQDDGLYLQRRVITTEGDQIEVARLDTTFRAVWRGYLPIERTSVLMGSRTSHGYLYMLFRQPAIKDLMLYAIDQRQGNFVRYTIKNFIPFIPSEFQVAPQAVIIGGYFNRIPVVIYFPFAGQKTKVLPGLLNESGELTQIRPYADGSFDVLISARNMQGQQTIWIKNYDPEGNLLRNLALEPAHRAEVDALVTEAKGRWDFQRIRADVIASQKQRRAIHAALTTGRIAPWDYAPRNEAAASYYRNYDSARPDPDRPLRRPRPAG